MNNATKTIPRILRDNICTGFNALNLMIAVALAAVGAWKNLLFIFIILINTTVSIVQEIRAKRQIERLTLLLAVAVMRGGKEQRIRPEELRKGDTPVLAAGNAVCTDCILQEGRLEVNEAIPTGESESVVKLAGDRLLSGSSIVAGRGLAKAECGADACFTAKQTAQLVLLDSDFSVLKDVISEGRRVINNLTKSAGVFFAAPHLGLSHAQMNLVMSLAVGIASLAGVIYSPCSAEKRKPLPEGVPHRFAVLIVARNEAAVIGNLTDSLKQQNYPAGLIDIYVVAGNCTDCTAEIAHAHGARVFERHDRSRVGKGFALSYLLRRIKREYDGYLVFDADNVVDRNYFREINKTFSAGYNIVRRETISYCPTAVFYDEQLTGFRQSVRQRMC